MEKMELDDGSYEGVEALETEEVPWGEWVWVRVFEFLSPQELASARQVCSAWARLSDDGSVWRAKCREAIIAAEDGPSTRLFTRDLKTADNALWKPLYRELSTFPVKGAGTGHLGYGLLRQGLKASSSDHPSQGIHQTLNPNLRTFWSSKGSADDQSSEYLVYRLVQPICIVHSVSITVYRAGYQKGIPVYGPQRLQVSLGFGPEKEDMHYVSPIFPVDNSAVEQTFQLAPELAAGGFLRIDLYGRVQTQPDDDLYYTVLQRVVALGLPIAGLDKPVLSEALVRFAVSRPCFHESILHPPTPESRKPPPKPEATAKPAEQEDDDEDQDRIDEDEGDEGFSEDEDEDEDQDAASNNARSDDMDELRAIVQRHQGGDAGDVDDSHLCRELLEVMQRQSEGVIGASQRAQQRRECIRRLLAEGKYSDAINAALDSPLDEDVRTLEVVGWFTDADKAVKAFHASQIKDKAKDGDQESVQKTKTPSVLYAYLQNALKRQKRLNEHETLAIAHSLGPQAAHLIAISAATGRLTCTEALGDLMAQLNQPLIAADIYMRAHVLDKVLVSLVEAGSFTTLLRVADMYNYPIDYLALLCVAKEKLSRRKALEFGLVLAQGNHGAALLDLDQIKTALGIEMAAGEWDIRGKLQRLVEDEAATEEVATEEGEDGGEGEDGDEGEDEDASEAD